MGNAVGNFVGNAVGGGDVVPKVERGLGGAGGTGGSGLSQEDRKTREEQEAKERKAEALKVVRSRSLHACMLMHVRYDTLLVISNVEGRVRT